MRKGAVASLAAAIISIFTMGVHTAALDATKIAIAGGYYKGNSSYDIVVKEKHGTKLVLYVNDNQTYQMTANQPS